MDLEPSEDRPRVPSGIVLKTVRNRPHEMPANPQIADGLDDLDGYPEQQCGRGEGRT